MNFIGKVIESNAEKSIETIQEKTGRECSQKKIVYPVYVISCIKIRDESGKGMR
jgi:hypothetical protein